MLLLSSIMALPRVTKSLENELKSFENAYVGPIVGSFKLLPHNSNTLLTCSCINSCTLSALSFSTNIIHTMSRIRRLAIIVSWYRIYTKILVLCESCIRFQFTLLLRLLITPAAHRYNCLFTLYMAI